MSFLDFRTADAPTDYDADLCIVGTGAAGLSIAKTLLGSKLNVLLLESALEFEDASQALYAGQVAGYPWETGTPQSGLTTSRLRFYGGSTNHWGGGCIPLAPMDFEKRDWIAHSGWPINRTTLDPYYERARPYVALQPTPFDSAVYHKANDPGFHFEPDKLTHRYHLLSPQPMMGPAFRDEIEASRNIRILGNANLLEFLPDPTARTVRQARIGTLSGKRGTVKARAFVLACGGIENARLLLLSNSVTPAGLGNARDLVGRFFMDHPSGKLGTLTTDVPAMISDPYNRLERRIGAPNPGDIALAPALQRSRQIANARLRPQDYEDTTAIPDGVTAVRELEEAFHKQRLPDAPFSLLRRILGDTGEVSSAIYRRLRHQSVIAAHHIDLEGFFEQVPNPDSRITLTDDKDALDQRRVKLDWQLTEQDWRTYRGAVEVLGAELGRLNLGRLQVEPWLQHGGKAEFGLRGVAHHLGTTRMADDAQFGVVDAQCRVHGLDNLYVAGGSVFPAAGYALPTFTIIALAIRLADRLNETLG